MMRVVCLLLLCGVRPDIRLPPLFTGKAAFCPRVSHWAPVIGGQPMHVPVRPGRGFHSKGPLKQTEISGSVIFLSSRPAI